MPATSGSTAAPGSESVNEDAELRAARPLHIGSGMKNILSLALVSAFVLGTGCSKKEASCADIVDHTIEIMPAEFKDKVAGDKDKAIAKCEKLSPEAKKCAMEAASMEDLAKCPHT